MITREEVRDGFSHDARACFDGGYYSEEGVNCINYGIEYNIPWESETQLYLCYGEDDERRPTLFKTEINFEITGMEAVYKSYYNPHWVGNYYWEREYGPEVWVRLIGIRYCTTGKYKIVEMRIKHIKKMGVWTVDEDGVRFADFVDLGDIEKKVKYTVYLEDVSTHEREILKEVERDFTGSINVQILHFLDKGKDKYLFFNGDDFIFDVVYEKCEEAPFWASYTTYAGSEKGIRVNYYSHAFYYKTESGGIQLAAGGKVNVSDIFVRYKYYYELKGSMANFFIFWNDRDFLKIK